MSEEMKKILKGQSFKIILVNGHEYLIQPGKPHVDDIKETYVLDLDMSTDDTLSLRGINNKIVLVYLPAISEIIFKVEI